MADRPDLVLWSLWSRNREEKTKGIFNHQTALALYELSDVNPAKLYMTVHARFRRKGESPGILVLHYADLPSTDVVAREGFQLTRPLRTILDCIEIGQLDADLIGQAIKQASDRGLITRQQVRQQDMSAAACRFFGEARPRVA